MIQTVIDNETYLTNEYIRLRLSGTNRPIILGRHPLTDRLGAFCHIPACRELPDQLAPDSTLWYVFNPADDDPDALKSAIGRCREQQLSLLCIILCKNIKPHSTIRRYAEMELLAADDALNGIRGILCSCPGAKAVVLDRLFGAEFDGIALGDMLKEAEQEGTVTVTQDMALHDTSFLYLPDAISAILTVSRKGKPGNLYNATSFCLSEYELRSRLYRMLAPHGVRLSVTDGDGSTGSTALDNGKLRSLGWEPVCPLDEALRCTIPAYCEQFDVQADYIRTGYSGKLATLRKLQLDMLREIDRICRAHGIRYFLSGGSMLGTVRHGGYIPWDDDIDVAFLREEYSKFQSFAPQELSDRFSYQSWMNGDGYHYFFDRITAKDTYFASRYSDSYEMPKGISVDIFVYDTVPDSPRSQRRHWKRLMNKRLLMNVRWKNEPRGTGKARLISRLLLPLLRLKRMDGYSASYDKATRRYEKRRTNTVMAPATDHDWHDCMPREWFEDVVPCRFEDVDTFLPKGWDGFLRNWYGDDYMTMLPLSKQQPYHDYYRLDVGSYADEASDRHFDFFGELKPSP